MVPARDKAHLSNNGNIMLCVRCAKGEDELGGLVNSFFCWPLAFATVVIMHVV